MLLGPLQTIWLGMGTLCAVGAYTEVLKFRKRRSQRRSNGCGRRLEVRQAPSIHDAPGFNEPTLPAEISPVLDAVPSEDLLISFHIMAAPEEKFLGYDLLQVLLSTGFQFGAMGIFHCYHEGRLLFSLAQATQPGTFDLNKMGSVQCTGLTLFMQVTPEMETPLSVFEWMLGAAREIAFSLEGDLENDHRELLDEKDVQTCRKNIRNFLADCEKDLTVNDEEDSFIQA